MVKNKSEKRFLFFCNLTIILLYCVILAGGIVRSTGSGMGCPDWPKCFGRYIPPGSIDELLFQNNSLLKKGYIIIHNEVLYKAKKDFYTTTAFDINDWESYTKHSYAAFNVYHTWTEYINRLVGALVGLSALIAMLLSFQYWRQNRKITLLNIAAVSLICYQAWLGAKVVESVLTPFIVSRHLFLAFIILALYILIKELAPNKKSKLLITAEPPSFSIIGLSSILFLITVIQTLSGAHVREAVNEIASGFNYENRSSWVSELGYIYYFHRTLSILVVLIGLWVWINSRHFSNENNIKRPATWNIALIALQVITGLLLSYAALPPAAQTIHLCLSTGMFGIQFLIILRLWTNKAPIGVHQHI